MGAAGVPQPDRAAARPAASASAAICDACGCPIALPVYMERRGAGMGGFEGPTIWIPQCELGRVQFGGIGAG